MPPRSSSWAGTGINAGADQVRQTIVETLEAPRLTGISTEDFVSFKQNVRYTKDVLLRRVLSRVLSYLVLCIATQFRIMFWKCLLLLDKCPGLVLLKS